MGLTRWGSALLRGVRRVPLAAYRFARRNASILVPLIIAGLSLLVVLYVGVWRSPPPSQFHSLGFAAEGSAKRGSTQPFPPACRARPPGRFSKVDLPPETQAGATTGDTSADLGQYTDTCQSVLFPNRGSHLVEPGHPRSRLVTSAFGRGLRMDIVVNAEPQLNLLPWSDQCGEATVDVVISGTQSFWKDHPRLGRRDTRFALGWDEGTQPRQTTRSIVTAPDITKPLAALNVDNQAPLHPAFFPNSWLSQGALELEQRGDAFLTSARWGEEDSRKPIQFRFQADWVEPRGVGSCYVVLPSLSANNFVPGQQNAVCALAEPPAGPPDCLSAEVVERLSYAEPPTFGRVVLSMGNGVLEESTPNQDDYESVWRPGPELEGHQEALLSAAEEGDKNSAPVWSCTPTQDLSFLRGRYASIAPSGSYAGNACGAIAVIEPPGAEETRTTIVIIGSIAVGIAAERFFEALFRRRRRSGDDG